MIGTYILLGLFSYQSFGSNTDYLLIIVKISLSNL